MGIVKLLLPILLISSACVGDSEMLGLNEERGDDFGVDAGPEDGDAGSEDGDAGSEQVDDGYNGARDVNLATVVLADDTLPPEYYAVPDQDSGLRLNGNEFWQRYPGGEMPLFGYNRGTELGRRCMYASAVRFAAIMADPPEQILAVRENTNWGGSFFNWNDDYSGGTTSASGPRLWAWRTGLIKWISQTDADGVCYLPTRDMVIDAAEACLARGENYEGEIQGCSAR